MEYNFTKFGPHQQRGNNFPNNVIRIYNSGMVVAANIINRSQVNHATNADTERENAFFLVNVDAEQNTLQLIPDLSGYAFWVRNSGNGHMNLTHVKRFGLPIGDYKLVDEQNLIFTLA